MSSRDAIVYGILNKVPIFSKKITKNKINGKLKGYILLQEQNHSIFWWDDTEHMLYFYTLIFNEIISIEPVRISFFQRLGNMSTLLWSSWVFFLFFIWLRIQISQISEKENINLNYLIWYDVIILTIHSNELRIYSTLKMFCIHVENGKTAASDFKCGARKLATAECIM